MKILNQFTLTLLSTMLLTACGGSGSSGNTQPEKPLQNNNVSTNQQGLPSVTSNQSNKEKQDEQPSHKNQQVDKTKPTLNITSEPKLEATPEKPNNKIDHPLTNTAIFDSLSRNGGSFESGEWVSLKLDDNENIQVLPLHEKMEFSGKEAEALFDKSGQLLGYLGYASFSHIKPNINNLDDEIVAHYSFPMLEMDPSQKTERINDMTNVDISYRGKFYYTYADRAVATLEGDVAATYRAKDNRLFLELFGQNNEHWDLKENANQRGVNVAENGSVFGQMYEGKTRNATFDGGIYGKNGEVLSGKLIYEDHSPTENNSWKGVLGAKAQ